MSTEEELKWMTKRYSWRFIPFRYQAMVATIVSALLYFNVFGAVMTNRSTERCGSLFRPTIYVSEGGTYTSGWIFNTFSSGEGCSRYYRNLYIEIIFSLAGIAICGLVMRRAIIREDAIANS